MLHLFLLKQVKHGDEHALQVLLEVSKYCVEVHVGMLALQVDVVMS